MNFDDVREHMGETIVLRTSDGTEHGRGRLVGYYDRPTVVVEQLDGHQASWVAAYAAPVRHQTLCCPLAFPHPPSEPGCSSSPKLWEGDQG